MQIGLVVAMLPDPGQFEPHCDRFDPSGFIIPDDRPLDSRVTAQYDTQYALG
jgi:hypothetical protein